jgi:hypothetical protein
MERAGFHVVTSDELPAAVHHRLATSLVYYAGSHEGCGCGFGYESVEEIRGHGLPDDVCERAMGFRQASVADLDRLRAYLQTATVEHRVTLLVTWFGDEDVPVSRHEIVHADHFGGEKWQFKAHTLFDVLPESEPLLTPAARPS